MKRYAGEKKNAKKKKRKGKKRKKKPWNNSAVSSRLALFLANRKYIACIYAIGSLVYALHLVMPLYLFHGMAGERDRTVLPATFI